MTSGIVVTGLGTVGSLGVGAAETARGLEAGAPRLGEVDRSRGFHRPDSARRAGLVDGVRLDPWLDRNKARRMSAPSRFAVAAARMALADAGLDAEALAGSECAVSLGTAFGATDYSVRILEQFRATGPTSVSPYLFIESVANAPAAQIALHLGLRGPNLSLVQGSASGLVAIAQALVALRAGTCTRALVGAVDEAAPMAHAALDRFGALSRGGKDGTECGRAFDAERDGFVFAEGATVLLLEHEEPARARGARIRARIRAVVRASDPSASAAGWGRDAAHLARMLLRGLERGGAGGLPELVVSGASGSRAGDHLEGRVLRTLWPGEDLPPVAAPKACCGEYGGGFLAAAILAASGEGLGPTPGFERVDPELGIRPHDGRRLPAPRRVLASSLAPGGAAAWMVLESV